ncbi:hypothetical protein ABW19_dt0201347 [Dactylella cylindrospora]|nr:hypothetical protein ABW19_dt0201347 [Dactylella cylindrospora]
MDPIAISGLAIGVLSLTFQLFTGCVLGCQLLLDAKGMPNRYRHLRLRLRMEQLKLLDWARAANLSERESAMGGSVGAHRHVVNDVLHQLETLLLDASTLSVRYGLKLATDEAQFNVHLSDRISSLPQIAHIANSKLLKKALDFAAKSRRYPSQLRWATFDSKRFEELLLQVGSMGDSLSYFLEIDQKRQLLQAQQNTFVQILQISNKMDDLFELLSSLNVSSRARNIETARAANLTSVGQENESDSVLRIEHEDKLLRLAKFKSFAIALQNNITYAGPLIPLPADTSKYSLELGLLTLKDPWADDCPRSTAIYASMPVWVEWRYYNLLGVDTEPPEYMNERISKMAVLLGHEMNPPEFRTPKCHGYILQEEHQRFGFVFENSSLVKDALPVSLHTLLADYELPSLTVRVEMALAVAQSIWYLHATNWVHKGLRSENIVFSDATALTAPSLCGFEYSRPAKIGELTEKPSNDPLHDLYRHPNAQFELPSEDERNFMKVYDIYSLGIILLEIGMWKRIDSILCLPINNQVDRPTARRTRSALLEGEYITRLEAQVGRIYAGATKTCLSGDFSVENNISDEEMGACLQLEFWNKVVKLLSGISV